MPEMPVQSDFGNRHITVFWSEQLTTYTIESQPIKVGVRTNIQYFFKTVLQITLTDFQVGTDINDAWTNMTLKP